MGSIPAIVSSSFARHSGARDNNSPIGLRPDEGVSDLPDLDHPTRRHAEFASREARFRQWPLLAQLVSAVDSRRADALVTKLLRAFGTLGGIFNAPEAELVRVTGSNTLTAVILAARPAVLESLREEIGRAEFRVRDPKVVRYLVGRLQSAAEERLHVIFLDSRRCYISDDLAGVGSSSRVAVHSSPLLRRAISLNAKWIVLVHNHPSGDVRPSDQDVTFTTQFKAAANVLGIGLFDHLIVSGTSLFSMQAAGLI